MGNAATLKILRAGPKHSQEPPEPQAPTIYRRPVNPPTGAPGALLEVARAMGAPTFSVSQLTISAWLKHPLLFGLRGFSKHYPDNNKVVSMLSGKRGLVYRGWIRRREDGLLQVEELP